MMNESNLVVHQEQTNSQALTNINKMQFINNDSKIRTDTSNHANRHNQHSDHVSSMTASSPSVPSRISSRSQSPVSFSSSSHNVLAQDHKNQSSYDERKERKGHIRLHNSHHQQHHHSPSRSPSQSIRYQKQKEHDMISRRKRSNSPRTLTTRRISPTSNQTRSSTRRDTYNIDHQQNYSRCKKDSEDEEDERDRYAGEFTSICLKNLNEKVRSDDLKQHVYDEFKRFGEFSIKIANNRKSDGERIVFLNFNNHKDAKRAKKMRINKMFLDYPLHIEPVFVRNKIQRSPSPLRFSAQRENSNRHSNRSLSPPRRRSPPPRSEPSHYLNNHSISSNRHDSPPPPHAALSYHHSWPHHHQANYNGVHNFERKRSRSPPTQSRRSRSPPRHFNHNHSNSRTSRDGLRYDFDERSATRSMLSPTRSSSQIHRQFREPVSRDYVERRSRSPVQRHERRHERSYSPINVSKQRHNDYHSNYETSSSPRTHANSLSKTISYNQHYSNRVVNSRNSCSPKRNSKSTNVHVDFSSSSVKRHRTPSPYEYNKSPKLNTYQTSNESNKNVIHFLDNDEKDATRTLFVGNLDNNISEDYLRSKFKSFGFIDSIDIKRDQLQANSAVKRAYAFIKYENMLMAMQAKLHINGNPLSKGIRCKIGFGKPLPTNCLWISGLTQKTRMSDLMNEMKHYASIVNSSSNEIKINWPTNETYAYVLFSSIKEANECRYQLNGKSIAYSDKLMVDYVDTKLFYKQIRKSDANEYRASRSTSRSPTRKTIRRVVTKSRSVSRTRSNRSFSPTRSSKRNESNHVAKLNNMENFKITTTIEDNVRRVDAVSISQIANQNEKNEINFSQSLNSHNDSIKYDSIGNSVMINESSSSGIAYQLVDLNEVKKNDESIESTRNLKNLDDEKEDGQIEDSDLLSNLKTNENDIKKDENPIENEKKTTNEIVEIKHEQEQSTHYEQNLSNGMLENDPKSENAQIGQNNESYTAGTYSNLIDSLLIDKNLLNKIETFEEFFDIFHSDNQALKENVWSHVFVLKKKIKHHAKFFLISGSKQLSVQYMSQEDQLELNINQRLRLDSSKMNEIQKKLMDESVQIQLNDNRDSYKFGLFVSVPNDTSNLSQEDKIQQQNALNNITSYLNEKEVAGVTLLDSDANIYTFTPTSHFSNQLLNQLMPNLNTNSANSKDFLRNFLIVLLLKN